MQQPASCRVSRGGGGFDTSLEVVEGTLIHIYGKVFKLTILGTCSFSLSLSLGFTWGPSSVREHTVVTYPVQ